LVYQAMEGDSLVSLFTALLSAAALTTLLQASGGEGPKADKILLGSQIGSATIISLTGVDTDYALVRFTRKLDDLIEDCLAVRSALATPSIRNLETTR